MKYIYKERLYYFFKRKIPYTNKNYSFSLKTKNLKTAKHITGLFLKDAESLFYLLKSMSKDEVLDIFKQMEEILNEYKEKALIEHKGAKDLEKKRMADFKHTFYSELHQKNVTRDCSHDKVAQHWLDVIQDVIGGSSNQRKGLFKRIFKRTEIDPQFYKNLSDEEKEEFEFMLIKTERDILRTDLDRATGDDKKNNQVQNTARVSATELFQEFQKEKKKALKHTTFDTFIKEYMELRAIEVSDSSTLARDREVLNILRYVSDKEYLIDYTEEEYTKALSILLQLSPKKGKAVKIYEEYGTDYDGLIKKFKDGNFPKLVESTGWKKFAALKSFLNYAVEVKLLEENHFKKRIYTYDTITKDLAPSKKRLPFNTSELNRLFSKSSWYKVEEAVKTLHKTPERFYIPLIGFFTGMRLNEIAALSRKDIKHDEDNDIYFIDLIEIDVKNETSKRIIPIHKFLLKKLKFLDYMNLMKDEERLFMNLNWHEEHGYGQSLSKAFNTKKFKSEWINEERLNDKNYMLDFHSFRHTALTRLKKGGLEEADINFISGHSQRTESQKTYITPEIDELSEYIHRLFIKDIDFTGLEEAVKEYFRK